MMEVVVPSHPCNYLFLCHQHQSIMDYKVIVLMNRPFHQFLSFLHHEPYKISDTIELRHGGGRIQLLHPSLHISINMDFSISCVLWWKTSVYWVKLPVHVSKNGRSLKMSDWATHMIEHDFVN